MLCSSNKILLDYQCSTPALQKSRGKWPQLLTHPRSGYSGQAMAWSPRKPVWEHLPPGGGGDMTDRPNETTLLVDGVPEEK